MQLKKKETPLNYAGTPSSYKLYFFKDKFHYKCRHCFIAHVYFLHYEIGKLTSMLC